MLPAHQPSADRARVLAGMGQILMLVDRFAGRSRCARRRSRWPAPSATARSRSRPNTLGLGLAALGRCREDGRARDRARDGPRARRLRRRRPGLREPERRDALCSLTREAVDVVKDGIVDIERLGATGSARRSARTALRFSTRSEAGTPPTPGPASRAGWSGPVRTRGGTTSPRRSGSVSPAISRTSPAGWTRFADLLEGQPVEGQYQGAYALAAAERALEAPPGRGGRHDQIEPVPAQRPLVPVLPRPDACDGGPGPGRSGGARPCRAGPGGGRDGALRAHRRACRADPWPDPRPRREQAGCGALYAALHAAEAERTQALGAPVPDAWTTAVDGWECADRPYQAAYSRFRLAEALLESGDRAAAREPLAAPPAGRGPGARPLVGVITSLARRSRIEIDGVGVPAGAGRGAGDPAPVELPSPQMDANRFGLTARERRSSRTSRPA